MGGHFSKGNNVEKRKSMVRLFGHWISDRVRVWPNQFVRPDMAAAAVKSDSRHPPVMSDALRGYLDGMRVAQECFPADRTPPATWRTSANPAADIGRVRVNGVVRAPSATFKKQMHALAVAPGPNELQTLLALHRVRKNKGKPHIWWNRNSHRWVSGATDDD